MTAANPFADDGLTPATTLSRSDLFEEITTTTAAFTSTATTATDTPEPKRTPQRSRPPAKLSVPWWRRPTVALPGALAIFTVAILGAVALATTAATPAVAAVTAAATASAISGSGRIETVIELREGPGPTATIQIENRFSGNDRHTITSRAEPVDGDLVTQSNVIRIGDSIYFSTGDLLEQGLFWHQSADLSGPVPGPLGDVSQLVPEQVVRLLTNADDFAQIESSAETATYGASLDTAQLQRIGVDALPPGLAAFAEPGTTDLPESLDVSLVVSQGHLQQLAVRVNGDTPDGFVDATVTTTYNELGEPQVISAPSPGQIDADVSEANSVLFEHFDNEPILCDPLNVASHLIPDIDAPLPEEVWEEVDSLVISCLEDAGETEVAEALKVVRGRTDG